MNTYWFSLVPGLPHTIWLFTHGSHHMPFTPHTFGPGSCWFSHTPSHHHLTAQLPHLYTPYLPQLHTHTHTHTFLGLVLDSGSLLVLLFYSSFSFYFIFYSLHAYSFGFFSISGSSVCHIYLHTCLPHMHTLHTTPHTLHTHTFCTPHTTHCTSGYYFLHTLWTISTTHTCILPSTHLVLPTPPATHRTSHLHHTPACTHAHTAFYTGYSSITYLHTVLVLGSLLPTTFSFPVHATIPLVCPYTHTLDCLGSFVPHIHGLDTRLPHLTHTCQHTHCTRILPSHSHTHTTCLCRFPGLVLWTHFISGFYLFAFSHMDCHFLTGWFGYIHVTHCIYTVAFAHLTSHHTFYFSFCTTHHTLCPFGPGSHTPGSHTIGRTAYYFCWFMHHTYTRALHLPTCTHTGLHLPHMGLPTHYLTGSTVHVCLLLHHTHTTHHTTYHTTTCLHTWFWFFWFYTHGSCLWFVVGISFPHTWFTTHIHTCTLSHGHMYDAAHTHTATVLHLPHHYTLLPWFSTSPLLHHTTHMVHTTSHTCQLDPTHLPPHAFHTLHTVTSHTTYTHCTTHTTHTPHLTHTFTHTHTPHTCLHLDGWFFGLPGFCARLDILHPSTHHV